MVSSSKYFILGAFYVFLTMFSLVSTLIVTPKQASAADAKYGNNRLYLVGKNCHDLNNINYIFTNNQAGGEGCTEWEERLDNELGCSGKMFYQHEADDGDKKWYTKQAEFKECYNRAAAQINLIEEKCKKVKNDTDLWNDKCEANQDHLYEALGCNKNAFTSFNDNGDKYWKPIPGAIQDCKNRLNAVASLKLIKIGTDGKPVESDKPIGDASVASSSSDPGEDASKQEPSCDASLANPLSWVLCPIMEIGAKMTDGIFQYLVKPLLQDSPVGIDSSNDFYKVWQSFRVIANILLIGVLLILVLAQLTEGWGLNMVDAYTAKKMAPRILIGVIAINISIYLCVAAVDITNIIGNGLNYILTKPFAEAGALDGQTEANAESAIIGVLAGGIAGGAITAIVAAGVASELLTLALLFIVPVVLTVAFAAMAVLFTLVIRFGLLVFLTVVSPIAIACFILPGTEKYFKVWWNQFLKTLIVYPIIAAIFAMSNIMAAIFITNSTKINDSAGIVSLLVGVIAVYVPLFLIPFSFKFAGGAIGAFGKFSGDLGSKFSSKAGEKYKKSLHDPNSTLGRIKTNRQGGLIEKNFSGKQIAAGGLAGYRARRRGDSFREAYAEKGKRIAEEHATSEHGLKRIMSTDAFQAIAGNDVATSGVLAATAHEMEGAGFNDRRAAAMAAIREEHFGDRADADLSEIERQQLLQNTDAAMSLVGASDDKSVANAAILNQAKSKTGFKNGMGDALKHINAVNGEDSVATMNMIGKTREAFQAAGRLDGSGASFGNIVEANNEYLGELSKIDQDLANGTIDAKEATARRNGAQEKANFTIARKSAIALSPYQIAQASGEAQRNIASSMAYDVNRAFDVMNDPDADKLPVAGSPQATKWEFKNAFDENITKKEWSMKVVAEADGMYRAIGSMGGKGKDTFGTSLMKAPVRYKGKEQSFAEVLDTTPLREDPTFRQFSYEFNSRYQQEQAAASQDAYNKVQEQANQNNQQGQ